jgi:avidin family protein
MRHAERSVFAAVHETSRTNYDFSGRWKNELGSILDIRVRDGVITGTYVSAVSAGGGPTPPFPVTGTVTEDLLVFTVNWGGLITTWCGHHVDADGSAQILTLWYLVKAVPDETNPANQWKMIEAGADSFMRA